MVPPLLKCLLMLSMLTTIRGADLGISNITGSSAKEDQGPRANRRQVKLYSGVRPTPIICRDEGFQEDPVDCSVFHRCMKSGKGRFVSFRFQCSPGTIYDPDAGICNHPEKTARVGCGGKITRSIKQTSENDINLEVPTPISTKNPIYGERNDYNNLSTLKPSYSKQETHKNGTKYPWQSKDKQIIQADIVPLLSTQATSEELPSINMRSTTSRSISFSNNRAPPQTGEICVMDGFMGDSENCRKFYRCVGNQRGGFIRYEFLCSDLTIWDEDKGACNHVWNVKRRRCGRGNVFENDVKSDDVTYSLKLNKSSEPIKTPMTTQTQTQINYGSKVTQIQSQISNGTVKQNQTQINYNDSTDTKQNQTQISYGSAVSQSQSQINYGNKGTQTQLQIDHLNDSSQTQNQVVESTSSTIATTMPSHVNNPQGDSSTTNKATTNNECTQSGFYGDRNDCKKFYRCVDNGKGSYTRYEFSCGEGTVWDPNLESCNHAWAVKECGGKGPPEATSTPTTQSSSTTSKTSSSTTTALTTSSTQNYFTPDEPITEEENEISYGNQPSSPSTSKPISPMTTVSTRPTNENQCKSSGFMGDNNDCKKFYRCVDNGNGQYTRYEFSCGEGTVWDSKIEACNHAWAVEKCGGNQNNDIEKEDATTTKPTQVTFTPSSSTSQVPSQNDDYDTGYGGQQEASTPGTVITLTTITTTEITTTTTTTEMSHNNQENADHVCITSGFMGDSKDCKKFYRCVDNGNGSYTRYEFSCGDGTVWDQKNQVCNHAWAVKKCGGTENNEIETTSEYGNTTSTTTTTTTVQSLVTGGEDDAGYGQESNASPSSSTTTESQPQNADSSLCTSSGFVGDNNDCKKFYRCVDNGNGGFTRYEFTCGEGTVWDSEIEACNHAWAVKTCGNNDTEKQPETSSQAHPTLNDQDTQGGYPSQNDEYTEKPVTSTMSGVTTASTITTVATSNKCQMSGFMGDSRDCKKFYRCVDDGQGEFIQYEFTCGEGTLWDQSIESCNHAWAVSNCNQSVNFNTTNTTEPVSTEGSVESENQGNNNQQPLEDNSTPASSTGKPSGGICKEEGFYGDENNCKNFYRCVDNSQGGYTKYDFTCGEGTVWNQEIQACDHESFDNSCKSPGSTSPTKKPDSQNDEYSENTTERLPTTLNEQNNQQGLPPSSDDKCEKEGFFGDSKNCKKFYRCVDNGKGSYTKYEFTCGEGTAWVQEIQACDHDNGITSCADGDSSKPSQQIDQTESTSQSNSQPPVTDKENNETTTQTSTKPSSKCSSEGFYGNENDCTKFYRCVDDGQGSFTKYDFTCGEGTAWDSDLQTCNHISEVSNCRHSNQQGNQIMHDEEPSQTTESTSTTKESTSSESSSSSGSSSASASSSSSESSSSSDDFCKQEGYYGNTKDCNKFYRCVDNGKGGYTKYDFDCGEGTIWDQDITTCNHPQDVANPSCKGSGEPSSTESSSTTSSSSMSQTTSTNGNQNCSQDNSSNKPQNQNVKCEKAGFYADPNDCKKFYRCVDWDGNGERFSIFHFDCGEGTIWDPQLDTCNHEDSVYPPRNCSGAQSQGENNNQENTTTEKTTTPQSTTSKTEQTSTTTTTQQSSSSEHTTQESSTTEQSTTQLTTTSSQTTTDQSNNELTTTTQQTTQDSGTTTEQTTQSSENTTQPSTTSDITTTQESSTSVITTTQQLTTSQATTTQPTTTSQQTTTQESTIEQSTTEQSTDSENTTTQATTTEQQVTTTEQTASTTQQIEQLTTAQQATENTVTTTDSTTEGATESTTESATQSATEGATQSTTEGTTESTTAMTDSDGTSTTESDQGTSYKDCPDTEDDQYLYVCPTSFRRHPKYCNMFYQCTEDDDSHETKIATFTCPNNTIYDESKIQCVEEDKADKKCDGQKARTHRVKRLSSYSKDPIQVDRDTHKCSTAGYYQFEKSSECSIVFLKCSQVKSGKLRGYVYQCPEGYVFWSISKKCEKRNTMKHCQESSNKNNWSDRWEIPVERKNIAK